MLSQPSIVPRRQRIKDLILAIVLIAAGVVFFRIAGTLSSNQPVVYADIVEHFKYGSIGSEPGGSLLQPIGGALPPYMVRAGLPRQLPGEGQTVRGCARGHRRWKLVDAPRAGARAGDPSPQQRQLDPRLRAAWRSHIWSAIHAVGSRR